MHIQSVVDMVPFKIFITCVCCTLVYNSGLLSVCCERKWRVARLSLVSGCAGRPEKFKGVCRPKVDACPSVDLGSCRGQEYVCGVCYVRRRCVRRLQGERLFLVFFSIKIRGKWGCVGTLRRVDECGGLFLYEGLRGVRIGVGGGVGEGEPRSAEG